MNKTFFAVFLKTRVKFCGRFARMVFLLEKNKT